MHQRDITIDFRLVRGADHFFQSRLEELDEEVEDYLTKKPRQQKIAAGGR
jgi:alpha/beta superfamily hydrolase